jgi:hypothetical protein
MIRRALLVTLVFLLLPIFWAGNEALAQQLNSFTPPPGNASISSDSGESAWDIFKNNSEAYYYVSWAGQSLGERQLGASYNPFTGTRWPMQFYSELYYGYRFAQNWTLGVMLSGIWNFSEGISNQFGPIETGLSFFHPALQLKRANLIDTSWLNVWGQMQVFFPTSSFAREQQTMLFSVSLDNTWTIKAIPFPFIAGITTSIQPTFYQRIVPENPMDLRRETLFLSAGHFLNYSFSQHFDVQTVTTFTTNHLGGSPSLLDFGPSNDDRWKIQFNWYPRIPVFSRMGVFVQGLIFDPMLSTTIVGADVTFRL